MTQISFDTKFHHHSNKDVTISRGANKYINITFRNDSWTIITTTDYMGFHATKDGKLTITDGDNPKATVRRKLSGRETTPNSRYMSIAPTADANVLKAFNKILRDKEVVNLDIKSLVPDADKGVVNDFFVKADEGNAHAPVTDLTDLPPINNVEAVACTDGNGMTIRVNLQTCTPEVRRFFLESLSHGDLVNECLYLLEKLEGGQK